MRKGTYAPIQPSRSYLGGWQMPLGRHSANSRKQSCSTTTDRTSSEIGHYTRQGQCKRGGRRTYDESGNRHQPKYT